MKLRLLVLSALTSLALAGTAHATPFTQCPVIGGWSSCAYLITINPDDSVTIASDITVSGEDIMIGVQNNSGHSLLGLRIIGASDAEFFDFSDNDFPYDGNGRVRFSDVGPCVVDGDCPTGTVNFVGGLLDLGHTWFGLEGSAFPDGAPIHFEVQPVAPVGAVPEPVTLALLGTGLTGLVLRRRKKPAA